MNHLKTPRNGMFFHSTRQLLEKLNSDLFLIAEKMSDYPCEFDEFDYLVMAIEDRRYLNHRGVDIKSIVRELIKMLSLERHGGASTIDMQMVRTITNYRTLSFKRKLYEITLAILINFKFSKHQIMKCYMDNAFFGSNLIGVTAASKALHGKKLNDLSDFEKAQVAAMLLKPMPNHPTQEWKSAIHARATYAQAVRSLVK
ncbi:biosynthetic peptidoglycan transglycosylase [Pseudomonas avellanae]|uniref:biosynthetic peptidoglycan transglycosylase n=1 Tax=Pseudomonas avellanae TaxID=46257 RepID=UPI0018F3D7E8|nr:biosynthetic peptidoglycan transglycosylase [Pseudomonas avellanae]